MSTVEAAPRIVLIDDNRDDRELAARILRQALPHVELIEVNDDHSFERALQLEQFGVVITDYSLRWTTGLEVLDTVTQRHPEVPVIMFTNTGTEEVASEGMKRGLFDYIVKRTGQFQRLAASARAALTGAELKGRVAALVARERRALDEREQLLAAERAARLEAERANRLKDEFLATVSHELRTPLNSILGWAHLLQVKDAVGSDELRKAMQVIERNARAQARLIEDLLDMSRIVAGTLRLETEVIEPRRVIDVAVNAVRPLAEAKRIEIECDLSTPTGAVRADPARLQQVVWNLLTNAVKFSPADTRVRVAIRSVDHSVLIIVSDEGQGIAEEFLPHIFDRFSQGSTGTGRAHGGLGIGLAIARHLIEAHGGTISVQSAGVGRGSTFTVLLPNAVEGEDGSSAGSFLPLDFDCPPNLQGVTVVAVDDDADALDIVCRALSHCNATVYTASSAAEGFELVRAHKPAVLLSDIGMPGDDGYAFIRRVRKLSLEEGGGVPAVALTAFARSEDRQRALVAGYHSHMAKPVDANELIAIVAGFAGILGRLPQSPVA
jgi:signal transduction histidine kinase